MRVYYEDTDAGGVVYYANYLKFMERARTEWLRALGFEQDHLREEQGVIFAVRHVVVDFVRPARFNMALQVDSRITACRGASLTFDQRITRAGEPPADVMCQGQVQVVCLDAGSMRPRRLPPAMATEIAHVC